MKKGTHKNSELMVSMLLILPDFIRPFKGPGTQKSNIKHRKDKNRKFTHLPTATVKSTEQLVKIVKSSVKRCLSQIPCSILITSNETIQQLFACILGGLLFYY